MNLSLVKEHATSRGHSLAAWIGVVGLALVFGLSYGQYPLYYHTQNQYFFHGVVRSGFGLLKNDWFAKTPDPWPVFTGLVELTYRYLDPHIFYIYFILLLGVYVFSLLGIVSSLVPINTSRSKFLLFLAVVVALHSPLFGYIARMVAGLPMASSPHHFNVGRILLLEGVGEKRILGDMLNPGTFGVFLLLSVYLFLRGRPFLAVVASTLAAMFQPSYVLHVGILTVSYLVIMVRRRAPLRRALGLGGFALALILPLLVYAGIAFRPTDPALWAVSQDILVRIAYYPPSVPALWLGAAAYVKVAIVVAALYVLRRTDLFWIMLLSFVAALGLTVVQMRTDSIAIALLLPWRISAFLVPLSTVILLAYGLSNFLDRYEGRLPIGQKTLIALSVAAMLVLVAAGIAETALRFKAAARANDVPVLRFVAATKAPGQTYLIPPNWRSFRLLTGAPVFAERSVIAYNDVGIMEWYERTRQADAFYGPSADENEEAYRGRRPGRLFAQSRAQSRATPVTAPSPEARCQMLPTLRARYGVTHVIVDQGSLDGCAAVTPVFHDQDYSLYAVRPSP